MIKQRHLRLISRRFWGLFFGIIIALAIVVQIGRQAFPLVNDYRHVIEEVVSEQLGVRVEIGEISARWRGLRPDLRIENLSIFTDDSADAEALFSIGKAYAELSIIDSVIQRGFAWRTITFDKFVTTFEQKNNGRWRLRGYDGGTDNSQNPFHFDDPLDIFLFGRRIDIGSAELHFIFNDGKKSDISVPAIRLDNDRFFHRMSADIDLEGREAIKVVIEGYGDPRNKKEFSASGYLRLNDIPTGDVYNAVTGADTASAAGEDEGKPSTGLFNFEMWFKGSPDIGITTKGRVRIDGVPERLQKYARLPHMLHADLSGFLSKTSDWRLNVQDMTVVWGDQILEQPQLQLHGNVSDQKMGLRAESFDVGAWTRVFNAANTGGESFVVRLMSALQLKGLVEDLDVALTSKDQGYFRALGRVKDGASNSFRGSPEIKNANARFNLNAFSGFVNVDVEKGFHLYLNKVFDAPFVLDKVGGQLAWRVDLDSDMVYLKSSAISALAGKKHVRGFFATSLPIKKDIAEAKMSLSLHIDRADAKEYASYLPKNTPKETQKWLKQAIDGGKVSDIDVFFSGSVDKNPSVQPGYQVMATVADASIEYDPKWPAITGVSGSIVVDSNSFRADVKRANLMGNTLRDSVVELINSGKQNNFIAIKSTFYSPDISRAKRFILASPLKSIFEPTIKEWTMKGAYSGKIDLSIPLKFSQDKLDYTVAVNLKGNELHVGQLDLSFKNIKGTLRYSKKDLLQGRKLHAKLWGKKVKFSLNSDTKTNDMRVNFSGSVDSAELQRWSRRPELGFLSGIVKAKGTLGFPTNPETTSLEGLTLEIKSELDGSEINLPEPLRKKPETKGDYWLQFVLQDNGTQRYRIRLNNDFFTKVYLYENAPPAIIASIGETLYADLNPVKGMARVTGFLEAADYDEWSAAYERYSQSALQIAKMEEQNDHATPPMAIKADIDLEIAHLYFKDIAINDVYLGIEGDEASWRFTMQSEKLAGKVVIPSLASSPDKQIRTTVDLDHLYLFDEDESLIKNNKSASLGADHKLIASKKLQSEFSHIEAFTLPENEVKKSVLQDVDLSSVALSDVRIKKLFIEGVDWGSWSFLVNPIESGLHFDNLRASVRKLEFGDKEQGADFFWRIENGLHESHFRGRVLTGDVGEALIAWDEERLLTSKSARFDTDIRWYDAPDLFSLTNIIGDIGLTMEQGSFIRGAEAGENPFLRLIALFNFDTLARRLRLDFSDLAAKGFAYDRVVGSMAFDQGLVTLTEPIVVESSSSKMQLAGLINISDETIDSALVVTLPVAGNLAVATAFVAGLPAAVGVYVVSKLLGKQVDKVSSINYSVKGSWENPKIKVRKIFNDSAARDFGESLKKNKPVLDKTSE